MTHYKWGAVLAIVALGLPFSGCASKEKPSRTETAVAKVDDLKVDVRTVVKDPARADKVIALLDDTVALLTEHSKELAAEDARIKTAIANYDTTAEDLRTVFASVNAARGERISRGIKLLEQMRTATTPDEWTELRKIRKKTLEAVMNAARPN